MLGRPIRTTGLEHTRQSSLDHTTANMNLLIGFALLLAVLSGVWGQRGAAYPDNHPGGYPNYYCGYIPCGGMQKGKGWLNTKGQISHLKVVKNQYSPDDCVTLCKANSQCAGFTYVGSANRCDLKATDDAASFEDGYPQTIISWVYTGNCHNSRDNCWS